MAPAVAAALISLVPAGVKAAKGLSQKKKAGQIRVGDKEVNERLKKVERDAATRATSSKFAGQSRVEEQIGQTSANILDKAKDAASPNEYLDMVAKQGGRLQDKQLEIGKLALTDKQRREGEAEAASLSVGEEETRIREENIAEQKATKAALQTASDQNISGGISDAAGVASTLATNKSGGEGSPVVNDVPAGEKTGSVTGSSRIKSLKEIEAEKEALKRINSKRAL